MGFVRCGEEFLNQLAHGVALRAHPALFHHHVALFVELTQNRLVVALRFQEEPQLGGVRGEAEEILGQVGRSGGVEAAPAGGLDRQAKFIRHDKFARRRLGGLEFVAQFLELGGVRLVTLAALRVKRGESLLHFFERRFFLRVIARADARAALERHVLEHVRQAGDARHFLRGADVRVRVKRNHGRIVPLEHDEPHAVVERELLDAALQLRELRADASRASKEGRKTKGGRPARPGAQPIDGSPTKRPAR